MPWGKVAAATAFGWFVGGKVHSKRSSKKLKEKHKEETKNLYTQYYNDVYSLKEQNIKLTEALESLGVSVTVK